MPYNIAIDGPAGAGKSTIAKALAKELAYIYVDTGAMYRAIALKVFKSGIDPKDEASVSAILSDIEIRIDYDENEAQRIYLNGEDVSKDIRKNEISDIASTVSQYQSVREKLLGLQRKLAAENSVVMDGRDIGSKILPNADLKIFLTASVHVRALRRALELKEKGENIPIEQIEKEIEKRDYRDSHRENAPLIKVPDAYLVDSSTMNIDETIDYILSLRL